MEPLVITGATGFLGSAFLARVLKNPHVNTVYLLSRRPLDPSDRYLTYQFESETEKQALWKKVHVVTCDLSNRESRQKAFKELQSKEVSKFRVFHIAAQISEKADRNFIHEINVRATEELVEWSNMHAVNFTFVSSVVAFGSSADEKVRTEDDFSRFESLNNKALYATTKRAAHMAVLNLCKIPYNIVCPSIIHGSWDSIKDTRSRLNGYIYGNLDWVPPGGANIVSIEHVLDLLEAGLKEPVGSSRVRLAVGANWSFKKYVETYLEYAQKPRPLKVMPSFIFRLVETFPSVLPQRWRSMIHGGRYLYFRSRYDSDLPALEKQAREAVRASVATLGPKN